MPTAGFDHAVLMLPSIEAAEALARRLGFTTTPRAIHPFGTGNVLVQFDDHNIEFLAVLDPSAVEREPDAPVSFPRFNRDFLARNGPGMAMTVVKAGNREAAERFGRAGLAAVPFSFSRMARGPNGRMAEVSFELTFAVGPLLADAGLFACRHDHPPERFYDPAYQNHPNGATGVLAVLMVAPDPAEAGRVIAAATGGTPAPAEGGVRIAFGPDRMEVLSPEALRARHGVELDPGPAGLRHAGLVLAAPDRGRVERALTAAGTPFLRTGEAVSVAPADAAGTLFAFAA